MTDRRDKLGRRIPEFDRSAAGKKAALTNKEKDEHHYNKLGTVGGKRRTRGYFGKLKDEGRVEELKTLSGKNSVGYFKTLKETDPKRLKEISQKGQTASVKIVRSRKKHSVPGGQS